MPAEASPKAPTSLPERDHDGGLLQIDHNFITLDLNGFAITGDGGTGDYGIQTGAVQTRTGIEIRNGTITNLHTRHYLPQVRGVVVERVRALLNTGSGIQVGNNCILKDNVAAENGSHGLHGGDACVASGNTAQNNSGTGLTLGFASTITDNAASNNAQFGIWTNEGSTVANNSTRDNGTRNSVNCVSNVVGNTATRSVLFQTSFSTVQGAPATSTLHRERRLVNRIKARALVRVR